MHLSLCIYIKNELAFGSVLEQARPTLLVSFFQAHKEKMFINHKETTYLSNVGFMPFRNTQLCTKICYKACILYENNPNAQS